MNCFDCSTESDRATTATGVCSACGAGVCRSHTLVDPVVEHVHNIGRPHELIHPGRRLHCRTCAPEHLKDGARQP